MQGQEFQPVQLPKWLTDMVPAGKIQFTEPLTPVTAWFTGEEVVINGDLGPAPTDYGFRYTHEEVYQMMNKRAEAAAAMDDPRTPPMARERLAELVAATTFEADQAYEVERILQQVRQQQQ
jgi:hypothetical protein